MFPCLPPYPAKQWAAVRTQECPTSTPPHISSPWSRTDTSQGQAPRRATLPPMIRPRRAVALVWGPPRCPQLPGGQSWGERGGGPADPLPGHPISRVGTGWPGTAVRDGHGGWRGWQAAPRGGQAAPGQLSSFIVLTEASGRRAGGTPQPGSCRR